MKRNDVALLGLIITLTLVISFLVVKAIFGEPQQEGRKVEKVEAISSTIQEPSKDIFNIDALNPTVVIQIGTPEPETPPTTNGQQ